MLYHSSPLANYQLQYFRNWCLVSAHCTLFEAKASHIQQLFNDQISIKQNNNIPGVGV